MTPKVRRGLGLLVLSALLVIADIVCFAVASWITDPGGVPDWLGWIVLVIAVLASIGALVAFFGGLALLAIGLLRERPAA